MTSQFIPSPVPACSHYEPPGIIVPSSPPNEFPPMNHMPAPSSSPCQECAIHNTIIQSMAFNMHSIDYGNGHRLDANSPCSTCATKTPFQQSQQHPALWDKNFYSQPIYQTHCGHNLAENYVQYSTSIPQNTQTVSSNDNIMSGIQHGWPDGRAAHEQKFLSVPVVHPPAETSNTIPISFSNHPPIAQESQRYRNTMETCPDTYESSQPNHLKISLPARTDIHRSLPSRLSSSVAESPTLSSGVDQLNGLSSMKIYEIDVKPYCIAKESIFTKRRTSKSSPKGKQKSVVEKRTAEARKRQPEDLCAVCGDRASGYHYNALTCEGCKGFFRRSITNKSSYKQGCKLGGNCEMDTYTRRKCPHCRFKKCKEVGMLEECLLTEIQCRSKRIRRQQRKQQEPEEDTSKTEEMSVNTTSPEQSSIASSPSESDGSQNDDSSNSLAFSEEEIKLIEAVNEAFKQYKINPDIVRRWEEYINKESKTTCRLSDITTVHVQVLVEYAKNIPGFLSLEYADQIALMKGSIFEAMLIRNSCGYHHLRREINKSAILDEIGIEEKMFDALLDFFKSIGKLGMDEIEYGLLIAIIIFNSDYDFVKSKDVVDEYQDLYLSALAKYSITRMPVRTAIFARILAMLTEIRSLSHNNAEIVASWKKRGALTPLLCEIWDLE